jgi:hypothetical protein
MSKKACAIPQHSVNCILTCRITIVNHLAPELAPICTAPLSNSSLLARKACAVQDAELVRKFERFSAIPKPSRPTPPEALVALLQEGRGVPEFRNGRTLRDYQVASFKWMVQHNLKGQHCILGDEMGLGKTAQARTLPRHLSHSRQQSIEYCRALLFHRDSLYQQQPRTGRRAGKWTCMPHWIACLHLCLVKMNNASDRF